MILLVGFSGSFYEFHQERTQKLTAHLALAECKRAAIDLGKYRIVVKDGAKLEMHPGATVIVDSIDAEHGALVEALGGRFVDGGEGD